MSAAPAPMTMAPMIWLRAAFGIEDAARGTHGQHAAHARFARGRVHADLDEVRAEGRQHELLVEHAEFDRSPRRRGRCLRPACASVARVLPSRDLAVLEHGLGGIDAGLLRDGFAQLDAGGVHAGRRAVRAPLAAGSGRHGKAGIAELDHHLVERHAHHLRGGLADDGVAARADVRHVGFDGDDALVVETHARRGFHDGAVAECRGHADAD